MNPKWKEKEQKDSFWVAFFWFGTRSRPFLFFFFPWFLSGSTCSLVCVCVVEGGQRAVIFDRLSGVKKDVIGEGTHFLIPWLQRPVIFDVRTRPRRVETVTGSKGNTLSRFFWASLAGTNFSSISFFVFFFFRHADGENHTPSSAQTRWRASLRDLAKLWCRLWRAHSSVHRKRNP